MLSIFLLARLAESKELAKAGDIDKPNISGVPFFQRQMRALREIRDGLVKVGITPMKDVVDLFDDL